ncbi:DUF6281 family protein [Streptomyces mirabilis]|uniref:DUF6281 family protein n=1 Tax=Streptomyces mirabilis TaxID=68239 RepID=UPI0036C7B7CE
MAVEASGNFPHPPPGDARHDTEAESDTARDVADVEFTVGEELGAIIRPSCDDAGGQGRVEGSSPVCGCSRVPL